MRFTLVWNGKLPSTGNSKKPKEVARIRADLHDQMATLWETHHALHLLRENGYAVNPESHDNFLYSPHVTSRQIADMHPEHLIDLCSWMPVGDREYLPLVRKSLDLTCELKILFLRQEDPGALHLQGGDLDGRIKCLLDALRMPSEEEQSVAPH